jgi:hypothetical protein
MFFFLYMDIILTNPIVCGWVAKSYFIFFPSPVKISWIVLSFLNDLQNLKVKLPSPYINMEYSNVLKIAKFSKLISFCANPYSKLATVWKKWIR